MEAATPAALFAGTDPEFSALFDRFAEQEVPAESKLAAPTRYFVVLAALLGCGGLEPFCALLPTALDAGLTPVELKELTYQATAYLGFGRIPPFLQAVNEALAARGAALPLAAQSTTDAGTRREAGTQAQVEIFGEHMREFWCSGPAESRHINRWLAANCFGDYYTRTGLDLPRRELATFCFLTALGGCEPQLTSHAAANLRLGNGRELLIDAVSQCLPYIGYPRALNALRCVREAAAQREKGETT